MVFTRLFLIVLVCVLLLHSAVSEESKRKPRKKNRKYNPQREALQTWASDLEPELDYNSTMWRIKYRSSTWSVHFNGYCKRLSDVFRDIGANINFVMIGACDGTNDVTIRESFLPNPHWKAVFVEPFTINVKDLRANLEHKNVTRRSTVLQGAATSECKTPTLVLERPLYEEKMLAGNTSKPVPHWLRRQIGSILPPHRSRPRKDWITEEVRCLTADTILTEWSTIIAEQRNTKSRESKGKDSSSSSSRRRRPHVLKIDVEGHDYEVLMSFLKDEIPDSDLPLLIDFEAKSIAKKYPAAVKRMEERGYVVSPYGADGFALLKGNVIENSLQKGRGGSKANIIQNRIDWPHGGEQEPGAAMSEVDLVKSIHEM